MPVVGGRATVAYLAVRHEAVIEEVSDDGRRLTVVTDEGERLEFILRRRTGRFHTPDDAARLLLRPT
jgi:hypothetical protein